MIARLRSIPDAVWLTAVAVLLPFPLHAQDSIAVARRDSTAKADSIARLHTVTITGTAADRGQPLGTTHIDAATIRETPAGSPYELLRQTAGLEVHEQGQGPGFASDASLRGFSSDHSTDLALWVDGVPVNEPVNGHAEGYNDWSLLFPGGIQDIDVIRGPTSPLFGNFALAGVVNVRTLERMRGVEVSATGGSYGEGDVMLLTGFDHGAAGSGVLGLRFRRETGFRPNSQDALGQLHTRVVHDLGHGLRVDGGAELYSGRWHSPGYLSEEEFATGDYAIVSNASDGGYKHRAQERVGLRLLRGNMLWRGTAYATQGRWQLFLTIPPEGGRFEGSGSQTEEEDRRAGLGATSAVSWELSHGELTIGGESRWDRSEYQNYFTTARRRDSVETVLTGRQTSAALFVQSHAELGARLRIDAGARLDRLSTSSQPDEGSRVQGSHGVFSPKLGLLVRLTEAVALYGNLSRGFRSTDGVISDPTLAPITAWAYESGVKLAKGRWGASAALFLMKVSNEQTFNPITLESTSGGRSRRQGLELDWRGRVASALTVSGSWTFNDARYRSVAAVPEEGKGPPVVLDGLRVFNSSAYVGVAAVEATTPRGDWRLRAGGNWVGPYSPFDEPGALTGAYGLAHLVLIRHSPRFEVSAGLRNLFDRAHPEVVAGHVVAPGTPRTATLSLRLLTM